MTAVIKHLSFQGRKQKHESREHDKENLWTYAPAVQAVLMKNAASR